LKTWDRAFTGKKDFIERAATDEEHTSRKIGDGNHQIQDEWKETKQDRECALEVDSVDESVREEIRTSNRGKTVEDEQQECSAKEKNGNR
jgi:hypothetical protein